MITLEDLDPLVPTPAPKPTLSAQWGTVTQSTPLRVRVDGPGDPLPYTPVSLTPGLRVGARVLCLLLDRQLVVMGATTGPLPPGTIATYAGSTTPPGWLFAHGHTVARAAFPALFEAIGTTFGAGDGVTSFRLPDLRGRVPVGLDPGTPQFATLGQTGGEVTHQLTAQEMPKHSHTVFGRVDRRQGSGDIFRELTDSQYGGNNSESWSAGDDLPHNNLQPYVTMHHIIKT